MNLRRLTLAGLAGLAVVVAASVAAASEIRRPIVTAGPSGQLVYETDDQGNRIPDFSCAGYGGGGVPLPVLPARVRVDPADGDDGLRLQAAIDFVSGLAPDAHGWRGAVLLAPGRYEIAGQLYLRTSGVVLRGSGAGADGTVLVATGTGRRALIEVAGRPDRRNGTTVAVADDNVPAGALRLRVERADGLKPGTAVKIERPSPAEWIAAVGMNDAPGRQPYTWKPGAFNVCWDRVITAVDGTTITLDAPLTVTLERRFGGATVTPSVPEGCLRDVGIENLRCESAYDAANPIDEQHAWNAVDLQAVRDGWVMGVTGRHFAGTVVLLGETTARVTVQDCTALDPVSEAGGYRRMAFHSGGQQTLFLRCRSEQGRNDFSLGYLAAGPNVFLECTAVGSTSFSGPIGSWASGALYDSVSIDGGTLRLDNLETWNQGVGWNAANSVLWNCTAPIIICRMPPGAVNWAVGVWGQFVGNGRWVQTNEFARPESLYRAQLAARLGARAVDVLTARAFPVAADAGAPTLEKAVPDLAARLTAAAQPAELAPGLALTNGWLAAGGRLLTGRQISGGAWWLGRLEPTRAAEFGPAITRFAPGRDGTGFTDDLTAMVADMEAGDQVAFRHHYGLWHDRRRIDHEMMRRPDGDVYPPFFELPFLRSGQGKAWDGLSRYDLTRYNPWYFGRLHEFAALARAQGRVLIDEMYFQHNIIESAAHWVDFPWRPANCLQPTGFTEPPPFTGDTIKMAAEFYDLLQPVRRPLHRAYIRQCLANLADQPNVIHTASAEFSGPLPFMQFWLDVVAEWEAETGRHPLIALSACKDVQDAILADPKRAAVVDVIDFTYWFRTADGREFAPAGGTQQAPRQHEREWHSGSPTGASIAGMVREYRQRFPGKAIISSLKEVEGWSFVAAGGSFPPLPRTTDAALLAELPKMQPLAASALKGATVWGLAEADRQYFVCAPRGGDVKLDLGNTAGGFTVRRIDPKTGRPGPADQTIVASSRLTLAAPSGPPALFWITRE